MNNRPSESTEKLIESLYVKKALWERWVKSAPPDEIIRLIEGTGELAAIPDLLPILIIGDRRSILASAEAIHHCCNSSSPLTMHTSTNLSGKATATLAGNHGGDPGT